MTGKPDQGALAKFQAADLQRENSALSAIIANRSISSVQDVANGVAFLITQARGGDANSQRLLKSLVGNLDEARGAAEARIVVPQGSSAARPSTLGLGLAAADELAEQQAEAGS